MSRIQWKSRRAIGAAVGLVVLYLSLRIREQDHKMFVFLPKAKPSEVWDFVADFSNMKTLNPTIVDFAITRDTGNYDHWKYSVEYSEHLSHWPHLYNHAVAHFSVKTNLKKDIFYIYSTHTTCLMKGFLCLDSHSEFRFSEGTTTKGTICEEAIRYQCPTVLSSFCRREVLYQRNAIMDNLKKHFSHKL